VKIILTVTGIDHEGIIAAVTTKLTERHLKVLGLFVRLAERDGKRGYLADLPLVLAYACDEAAALPHTVWMADELRRAIPRLQEKLT